VLGFDFGTRVIGVAVGNRLTGARALTTVGNGEAPDWQRLDALIREWRPRGYRNRSRARWRTKSPTCQACPA